MQLQLKNLSNCKNRFYLCLLAALAMCSAYCPHESTLPERMPDAIISGSSVSGFAEPCSIRSVVYLTSSKFQMGIGLSGIEQRSALYMDLRSPDYRVQ